MSSASLDSVGAGVDWRLRMTAALAALMAATAVSASAATFTNTPLIATGQLPTGFTTAPTANSTGDIEPAIAFANNGTMAVDGLAWNVYDSQLNGGPLTVSKVR